MTRRGQSGVALPVALAALLVASAATAALCLRTTETVKSNVLEREKTAARYAAQAGVEIARDALRRDASWTGATTRFDAFALTIRATNAPDGRRVVRVVASSPAAHAAVEVKLRLSSGLPAIESWRDE